MLRLSVCAETVYPGWSLRDRALWLARKGFGVELWWWHRYGAEELRALVEQGITLVAFTGYRPCSLVDPHDEILFRESVEESAILARELGVRYLVLHAGLGENGQSITPSSLHPATAWIQAYKNLSYAARIAEAYDLVFCVENLNTKVDHPGYPWAKVEDIASLLHQVQSPRVKLLLDLYHAQVEEGNLTTLVWRYASLIGHVHVADVPGRYEPGTGEICWPTVVRVLREVGYEGWIGLEAFPIDSAEGALDRFRRIFHAE